MVGMKDMKSMDSISPSKGTSGTESMGASSYGVPMKFSLTSDGESMDGTGAMGTPSALMSVEVVERKGSSNDEVSLSNIGCAWSL